MAYDMITHSWIIETLKTVKAADDISGHLCGSMDECTTLLTCNSDVV